jgi:DNA modification methylase
VALFSFARGLRTIAGRLADAQMIELPHSFRESPFECRKISPLAGCWNTSGSDASMPAGATEPRIHSITAHYANDRVGSRPAGTHNNGGCWRKASEGPRGSAYMLADNKLTDRSSWDDSKLAVQLRELSTLALDFDIEATGFEAPEIDFRIQSLEADTIDKFDDFEIVTGAAVTVAGDLWHLGDHRLYCGNALDQNSYASILGGNTAAASFTDPPYNVRIDGHVTGLGKVRHREFTMASGEMSEAEFEDFLTTALAAICNHLVPGALIYVCMDWRHMDEALAARRRSGCGLANLCVWAKGNGGMGSMYRSQHELVFVLKNGAEPHQNNIQLGKFGRNRTNVWHYPGANSFARRGSKRGTDLHPTVKPVLMVADAILDCTQRNEIVLDPFLGSGTTLLAAERTGRRCCGIELDPLYIDTAIERWQRMTGRKALNPFGETFDFVKANRRMGS